MACESTTRPKLQGRRVPISAYLDEDVFDQLTKLAAQHERSLAAEMRLAIRAHLERETAA